MAATDQNVIGRLDEIADQGRQNASELKLLRTKLFGSEEDHYEAGRLPVLERTVNEIKGRIEGLENERVIRQGRVTVLHPALVFLGRALVAALSALGGAIFGAHFKR